MFGLTQKIFIGLLTDIKSASNHTKCILLSNQKCVTQTTLINSYPNDYTQESCYYPFTVTLDRCVEICNSLSNLFNKVCVKKTRFKSKHVKHNYRNKWIKNIKKKYIMQIKFKFNGKNTIQINNGRTINVDVTVKNVMYLKKIVWNPVTCSCENEKYLASIMDDSAIICDKVIDANTKAKLNDKAKSNDEETKTVPTHFHEKKATCKTQTFYILLAFLWITIALLIPGGFYCYMIKYWAKPKHLLPFQFTNI